MGAQLPGYTLGFVQSMLTARDGRASGWFKDLQLNSVFQPAYSLPHKKPIGIEAHLRGIGEDGSAIGPRTMFGPVQNFAETCLLDLLGTAIHVQNFCAHRDSARLLFIDLHPAVFLDHAQTTHFLQELFRHYGIAEHQLALDVPADQSKSQGLDAAIAAYRAVGCVIALDDFDPEAADLDIVARIEPDIVKINLRSFRQALAQEPARRRLVNSISLLHEMGTMVLLKEMESEEDALLAIESDADFASGFYFGPLHDDIEEMQSTGRELHSLWDRYKQTRAPRHPAIQAEDRQILQDSRVGLRSASPADIHRYRDQRRPFIVAIQRSGGLLEAGAGFQAACREFLKLQGAIRCFLLGADGGQIGPDILADPAPMPQRIDFSEMIEPVEGDWSRRDFFRRAMQEPAVVQVTRRYRSWNGYAQCVTFSITTSANGKPVVICGDVDWSTRPVAQ